MLESATPDLPDDVESLRALLVESRRENRQLRSTLIYRDAQIEKLLIQLARLKRMQFGAKSEKLDREIEQLELLIEELQTPGVTPSRAATDALTEKAAPVRRPLPAHLPRESVVHAPAAACPSCGGALRMIGEDVSEMLDYVPAHWKVIRHVRPKCACDACQQIVQAEAPSRPIPRGIAAPGLLAHVLVAKYCDSLPLHRQAEIYGRDGVEIERSTLADWVGGSAALLAPLVERLGVHVMSAAKLHADDTPVPVLSPGRGQTKTGRLWTYVRDDRPAGSERPPAVFFQYTPDRRGEHPRLRISPKWNSRFG
jgi:transposase